MQSFSEIIKAFGGPTKLAGLLKIPVPTVQAMATRDSIALDYWEPIAELAKSKRITGVTVKRMTQIAAEKRAAKKG